MTLVAPRIVNDLPYVSTVNHEIYFEWQAHYLLSWRMTLVAPRIVNDLPYVSTVNHEIHFAWQAQYLLKLEDDSCCFAHCK